MLISKKKTTWAIIGFIGCCVAFFIGYLWINGPMRDTAVGFLKSNSTFTNVAGNECAIGNASFWSSSAQISGGIGKARLRLKVKGGKVGGHAIVELEKNVGPWKVFSAHFVDENENMTDLFKNERN